MDKHRLTPDLLRSYPSFR